MSNALRIMQLLVAPVVLISANGLICLALYNRLASIVTRARAFHKERFESLMHLSALPLEQQKGPGAHHHRERVAQLEDQGRRILSRARLIRNALVMMLTCVLCMLACSLALGASLLSRVFEWVALALFAAGVGAAMTGVLLAIVELTHALDPVTMEHTSLSEDATMAV